MPQRNKKRGIDYEGEVPTKKKDMKIRICINGKKLRKIISHINLISHLVFYLMVHKIYICRLGVDFHCLSLHFNIHLYLPLSFLSSFLLRRFFLFFIFSSFSCMFVFMPLFYSLKKGFAFTVSEYLQLPREDSDIIYLTFIYMVHTHAFAKRMRQQ